MLRSLAVFIASMLFFCACSGSKVNERAVVSPPSVSQIMLLVFDVRHTSATGPERFILREKRLREGTIQRPSSQELIPGKLVANFLDSMERVRRWEVVDDPLATEYEYPSDQNSGFGHTVVRKDSSSLAMIVPFDPLVKEVRFEAIGASNERTILATTLLAAP